MSAHYCTIKEATKYDNLCHFVVIHNYVVRDYLLRSMWSRFFFVPKIRLFCSKTIYFCSFFAIKFAHIKKKQYLCTRNWT